MKIWVIGRGYPTPENRMCGSFEFEQAKLLAREGNDVCYIALTLSFFKRKDQRGLRYFEEGKLKVFVNSHFYFPGKIGIYLEGFEDKLWHKLFVAAENETGMPDIIHLHYPTMICSINEIDKYKKLGVKLFVTEHWSHVMINKLRKHEKARLRYYSTFANGIISVSEALEYSIKKTVDVSVPTKVIPNIVSPIFFETMKIGKKSDDCFTFIAVGRLIPIKQFDIIIKQFIKDFSGNKNVKLRIVGVGPELKSLEALAKGNSQISFAGGLTLSNVAKEISNANVLVSYSKYETFAVPVAEAWACGKPTIVSRNSGVASFVNKDTGIVVDGNNPDSLSTAMRTIITEYSKYEYRIIKEYANNNFSDKAILDKIELMYKC